MAAHDKPLAIGAYMFNVDEAVIFDTRRSADHTPRGKLARIATHAGRILESRLRPDGLRKVTDKVHASHDGADLVLINQPPNAMRRQHGRDYHDRSNVSPAFMIVRNPQLAAVRVGRARPQFFKGGS